MGYDVVLTPRAEATYHGLAYFLQEAVDLHLTRLADSPALLARPTVSPPYPPGELIYEFGVDDPIDETLHHHLAIFFRYGQDESTLFVHAIGHTALRREE